MKKWFPLLALLVAAYFSWGQFDRPIDAPELKGSGAITLASAYAEHKSDIQVEGDGIVLKTLPDDNDGSRHQRFILKLGSGQTLLIAHNIDLAPRISALKKGDSVAFNGEYEWTPQGGVVHWTHRDPRGQHVAGWLKHNDKIYQ